MGMVACQAPTLNYNCVSAEGSVSFVSVWGCSKRYLLLTLLVEGGSKKQKVRSSNLHSTPNLQLVFTSVIRPRLWLERTLQKASTRKKSIYVTIYVTILGLTLLP